MHRAIETRYQGYRFRSRLEARYAVLFDSLKIKWDYEPEGFELGGGLRYLPDFWLHVPGKPDWGYWVEIKPTDPTDDERLRLRLVCEQTGHKGYFLIGTPGERADLQECAPLLMCAADPITRIAFHQAVVAARSARFEFGESGVRT